MPSTHDAWAEAYTTLRNAVYRARESGMDREDVRSCVADVLDEVDDDED